MAKKDKPVVVEVVDTAFEVTSDFIDAGFGLIGDLGDAIFGGGSSKPETKSNTKKSNCNCGD